MHLRTITWLLLLLNVAFGEQKQSRRCMVSLVPCHGRDHVPGSEGDRADSLTLRCSIGR